MSGGSWIVSRTVVHQGVIYIDDLLTYRVSWVLYPLTGLPCICGVF